MSTIADGTRNSVIEITSESTSCISGVGHTIVDLARGGVTIVVCGIVLVAGKHLLAMDVWVEIAHVMCVAMSETSGIQKSSVIVNCSRTVGNLVASVAIHVSHGYSVGTLSVCRSLQSFGGFQYFSIGIMKIPFLRTYGGVQPLGGEPLAVEIHRPQIRARVISAAHHRTRIPGDTVEMSHACEIPLATVALTF